MKKSGDSVESSEKVEENGRARCPTYEKLRIYIPAKRIFLRPPAIFFLILTAVLMGCKKRPTRVPAQYKEPVCFQLFKTHLDIELPENYLKAVQDAWNNELRYDEKIKIDKFSPSPLVGEGRGGGANSISPSPLSSPIQGEEIIGSGQVD